MNYTKIALLGEYTPAFAPHAATVAAIAHSCEAKKMAIDAEWVSTADIRGDFLTEFGGVWVAPGSPYKDMEKTLWIIRQCRETRVPCFGTCGGFQHIVIEYARNVLGFTDAQHAEYNPYASRLFISRLACSLVGREMKLCFKPDSRVASIYGVTESQEQYYCNFGVAPDAAELLQKGPLRVVGSDAEGEIRVIEMPGHPFFIGTLFVPQLRSCFGKPHPLVTAFLESVVSTVKPVL